MVPKLSINFYKSLDLIIVMLPIIIILGSPFINAILLLSSIIFLYICYKYTYWSWIKETWVIIALSFWLYLVIISFYSLDPYSSLRASFFYFRFILFSLLVGYFGFKFYSHKKIFSIWFFIIIFVCIDIWVQYFFDVDLFGYKSHAYRYSGVFGDELVAGSFLWKISSPVLGFFIYEIYIKKNKVFNYLLIVFFLIPLTILVTGERTSFIMFVFTMLVSLFVYSFYLKKFKIIFITTIFIIPLFIITTLFSSDVRHRYKELYSILNNFEQSSYGVLFTSGLKVWDKNKTKGVGLKNFGKVCDKDITLSNENNTKHQTCSTHPHNLYIQLLSETGIIGLLFFINLFIFFFLKIFKNIKFKNVRDIKTYLLISCSCSLFSLIWPIVTSGSFYSSWNGIFYWIIIGILINLSQKKYQLN